MPALPDRHTASTNALPLSSASGQAGFASRAVFPKGQFHFIWGLLAPAVSMAVKLTPPLTPPDWNGLF